MLEHIEVKSIFHKVIKSRKFEDKKPRNLIEKVLQVEAKKTILYEEGVLRIQGCICVPRVDDLIPTIFKKAQNSMYSIHLGATNI